MNPIADIFISPFLQKIKKFTGQLMLIPFVLAIIVLILKMASTTPNFVWASVTQDWLGYITNIRPVAVYWGNTLNIILLMALIWMLAFLWITQRLEDKSGIWQPRYYSLFLIRRLLAGWAWLSALNVTLIYLAIFAPPGSSTI